MTDSSSATNTNTNTNTNTYLEVRERSYREVVAILDKAMAKAFTKDDRSLLITIESVADWNRLSEQAVKEYFGCLKNKGWPFEIRYVSMQVSFLTITIDFIPFDVNKEIERAGNKRMLETIKDEQLKEKKQIDDAMINNLSKMLSPKSGFRPWENPDDYKALLRSLEYELGKSKVHDTISINFPIKTDEFNVMSSKAMVMLCHLQRDLIAIGLSSWHIAYNYDVKDPNTIVFTIRPRKIEGCPRPWANAEDYIKLQREMLRLIDVAKTNGDKVVGCLFEVDNLGLGSNVDVDKMMEQLNNNISLLRSSNWKAEVRYDMCDVKTLAIRVNRLI